MERAEYAWSWESSYVKPSGIIFKVKKVIKFLLWDREELDLEMCHKNFIPGYLKLTVVSPWAKGTIGSFEIGPFSNQGG